MCLVRWVTLLSLLSLLSVVSWVLQPAAWCVRRRWSVSLVRQWGSEAYLELSTLYRARPPRPQIKTTITQLQLQLQLQCDSIRIENSSLSCSPGWDKQVPASQQLSNYNYTLCLPRPELILIWLLRCWGPASSHHQSPGTSHQVFLDCRLVSWQRYEVF